MRQQRLLTWLLGLLTALAAAAVLWLCWRVLQALGPVVTVTAVGGLLAILLQPVADRIQHAIRSRPLAALAVVLLILAPFVVCAAWLATTVLGEAQGLLVKLPAQLAFAHATLTHWQTALQRFGLHVDLAGEFSAVGAGVLHRSITLLSAAATVTADTVIALIVAFFLIWDGDALLSSANNLLPRQWRAGAADVARLLARTVAGYIRGQVVVAAVFGVLIGVSMAALGLPDPILLGFLAGMFELLPTIGPVLAAVGPVGLALAQPFPHVLWVLLVVVLAQQLESNVLVPRISGGAVGLHPLTVILAVFGGWSLAGLGGALLAVPAAAVGRELLRRWWQPGITAPAARRWPAPGAGGEAALRAAAGVDTGGRQGARTPAAPAPGAPDGPVHAAPPPGPAATTPPLARTARQRRGRAAP